ncbi:helix-turn-helix domain-containing protein [Streptomyces sp. NPDC056661]|uniref:helix-turn-helix transcriptional regulator n=1 Tax=Streptomyces sp. NPDC056661 TaxID=3345898 RepID=UPI00369BB5A7
MTGLPLERIDEARRALMKLRVIEPAAVNEGSWRALSPRTAVAELVLPVEAEVQRHAAHAEHLRAQLEMLLPVQQAVQRSDSNDIVEVLTSEVALRSFIEAELARCTTEVAVMLIGAPDVARDIDPFVAASTRGVKIRCVLQHAARHHPRDMDPIASGCAAGVEFRSLSQLPVRLQVFDQQACVVSQVGSTPLDPRESPGDDHANSAVVVRQPLLVSLLSEMFEDVWIRSARLNHADLRPAVIDDDLRRSVLRLLADGAKDDAVAKRLGISLRTCRRLIAGMMETLGASSRFQAGVEAHRQQVVDFAERSIMDRTRNYGTMMPDSSQGAM